MKKAIVSIFCLLIVVTVIGLLLFYKNQSSQVLLKKDPLSGVEKKIDIINKIKFEDEYYLDIADSNKVYTQMGSDLRLYGTAKDDGTNLFFCSLTNIYRSKKDGTAITSIFSRQPSGVKMEITKIDGDWIYFEITSEEGISVNKIKKDGSGYEFVERKDDAE